MMVTLYSIQGHAQEDVIYYPRLREQIQPSPISRIYPQYLMHKPDLSTGAMDISILLYTAETPGFSIPFELKYHGNGIKVTDPHFPLGYGWMLSPGLRITRNIIGKADEQSTWEVRTNNFTYEYLWKLDSRDYDKDASHDVFSIHLPDRNNTFLLEKDGTSWKVLAANSPLKITPVFDQYKNLTEFSVTDDRGIIYKFGGQYIEKDTQVGYPTAWMLYEVILPGDTSNKITISWEKVFGTFESEEILGDCFVIQDYFFESTEEPGMPGPGYRTFWQEAYNNSTSQGLYLLKEVRMPNQTISFINYKYPSCTLLTGLKVKDPDGVIRKECRLEYEDYRTLNTLYVSGEGIYNFEYYGGEYMDTRSQDYWGYYNGKLNSTLVPNFKIRVYDTHNSLMYPIDGADRRIDSLAMQNFMLKKITYPTRGYMEIEYEPHRFVTIKSYNTFAIMNPHGDELSEGGGLRVKRTVSCAENGAPQVVRTYKYGVNEDGKGIAPQVPLPDMFVNEQSCFDSALGTTTETPAYRQLIVCGTARCLACPTYNPNVWYKEVTEYEGELKTTYNFDYTTNNSSTMSVYDGSGRDFSPFYMQSYNNLAQKGARLTRRISYRKEGSIYIPVEKEEYSHTLIGIINGGEPIKNVTTARHYTDCSGNGDLMPSHPMARTAAYYVGIYYINLRDCVMRNKKTTRYEENDSIVTVQSFDYEYQDNRYAPLRYSSRTDSRGETYTDYFYYPWDTEISTLMTSGQRVTVDLLRSTNHISQPLVYLRKKGDTELYRKIVQFRNYGNNLLLPEKEFYKKGSGTEEERITYQDYDSRGNLLGATQSRLKTVWLWGYNKTYPVAKIEGATYGEVKNWLGESFINALAGNKNETSIKSSLKSLRSTLSNKNVLVTTYTYVPLTGIDSITAPNGTITFYVYDAQGRLIEVKDNDNKIMEQYEYHYKP